MRKLIIAAGALIFVLLMGVFFFLAVKDSKGGSNHGHHLSNGASIRMLSMEYTNGNHTFNGATFKSAPTFLKKIIPDALAAKLGLNGGLGSMSMGGGGLGTNICVWIFCDEKGSGGSSKIRMLVSDEEGNSFQVPYPSGVLASYNGLKGYEVEGFCPEAFPRRGKTLTFSCSESVNKTWVHVADFHAPNPAAGVYPEWAAESLPATGTNGDLTVSLLELQSCVGRTNPRLFQLPGSNEVSATRAVFLITQTGRETNAWRPRSVEIWDATGNHWVEGAYGLRLWHVENRDELVFDNILWPGERAWKIKFEFARIADFAPEETCTFTNIALPGETEVNTLSDVLKIGKTELKLEAISGVLAEQPGNLKWWTVKKEVNISVGIKPLAAGEILSLIDVTDDLGRKIEVKADRGLFNLADMVFSFKPAKGAKSVNMTLSLHKGRSVEFQVRPEFPTNAAVVGKN